MSSDLRSGSRNDIDQVLEALNHFDLSASVEYEVPKHPVARGGYGEVYKGSYKRPDGCEIKVAIKCLTLYLDGSRDTTRIFKREIQAWSRLSHPNILPLLGYIFEGNGSHVSFPLISEWMDNGNVLDFVKLNPDCDITKLALDIASGLEYLHEKNIVHSDLKSANVLISKSQRAVICDFGSSHMIRNLSSFSKSSEVTGLRGTSRWLAYELLAEPEKYPTATKASDTWAFGMTIYEIITKGYPYAHIKYEVQILVSIVNQKLPRPPEPLQEGQEKYLWDICTLCWAWEPSERPTMAEVRKEVDKSSRSDSSGFPGNLQARNYTSAGTVIPQRQLSPNTDLRGIREGFSITTTVILEEHDDEVWIIKWSNDGQYLASASRDRSVFIWYISKEIEPNGRECVLEKKLQDFSHPVCCLAWSPNDTLLVTGADTIIKVWSTKSGLCLRELISHEETVSAVEWLPDGSGFLSAGLDRKIILWDASGSNNEIWIRTSVRVTDLAITPDSSRLIVLGLEVSRANTPALSRKSRIEERFITYDYVNQIQQASVRLESEITSVRVSQDSRYALINQAPDKVQLWDLNKAVMVRKFTGQRQGQHVIRSCFGGVDGCLIVSGSEDGKVYVWDRDTSVLLGVLTGHGSGSVNTVAWNPTNERMFASCSDDGTIRIWESLPLSSGSHTLDAA